MRLECRAFDEAGMSAAILTLRQLRDGTVDSVPAELLTDDALTRVVGTFLPKPPDLPTRWHLGIWLYRELNKAIANPATFRSPGFWTWLALAMFSTVCPPGTDVGEDARYILNRDDYRKRYRHLLAGPFFVFSTHEQAPQILKGLLATEPSAPGDLYEQIASRQELITSAPVVEAVNSMYFDTTRGALRRGASANARRLAEVLMQYDVTFDFSSISTERLLALLPAEFDKFTSVRR
jgi:hypothetical protein